MREIKFKAWDKIGEKMKNVECIFFDHKSNIEKVELSEVKGDEYEYTERFLDDVIPLQYTGLKDKNGKEIYEGDIVHYRSEDVDVISEIGFDEGLLAYAMYSWEGNYIFGYEPSSVFEIIGNIYENPELLEGAK